MGIQLYYNMTIDQWWQTLVRTKRTNVGWVKVQADWSWLQPDGPGQTGPAFSIFRSHVQRAYNDGFNVLVSVAKAPAWARSTPNAEGPPSDPQQLANFLNLMLGEVGGQIDAVEIWNEPNLRVSGQATCPLMGQVTCSFSPRHIRPFVRIRRT